MVVGQGDLQHPSRSRGDSYSGHPPASEIKSAGLHGGWSHFGAHARGTCLWHRPLDLNLGHPPSP
jgi:hypothetical protein